MRLMFSFVSLSLKYKFIKSSSVGFSMESTDTVNLDLERGDYAVGAVGDIVILCMYSATSLSFSSSFVLGGLEMGLNPDICNKI